MKPVSELTREQLETIVSYARSALWETEVGWDIDKDVDGSEFITTVGGIMARYGLEPDRVGFCEHCGLVGACCVCTKAVPS